MGQKVLTAVMYSHLTGRDMGIDLSLTLLPGLCPEPLLVGRDRQSRTKLDDTVTALGQLELRTGLVEMQALAQLSGQGDHAAALYADVAVVLVSLCSHTTMMPRNRRAEKRQSSRTTRIPRETRAHPAAFGRQQSLPRQPIHRALAMSSASRIRSTTVHAGS